MDLSIERRSARSIVPPTGGLPPVARNEGQPLMHAVAGVVTEFEGLKQSRENNEVPEHTAYLSNGTDSLVLIRKYLPKGDPWGRKPEQSHADGYFAEVFDMDEEGWPAQGLTDISILNGLYQRAEVDDDSPIAQSGLIPTKFSALIRERLKASMPKGLALPKPGEADKGILGQLFAQRDIRNVQAQSAGDTAKDIKEAVVSKYYGIPRCQGYSNEVGNSHVIFSARPDGGVIGDISRKLGLDTEVVSEVSAEIWDVYESGYLPMAEFKDDRGLFPLIWTIDHPSFPDRKADIIRSRSDRFAEKHPMFAVVNVEREDPEFSEANRLIPGWYHIIGLAQPDVIQRLYLKLGIDRLLTDKTREIARNIF